MAINFDTLDERVDAERARLARVLRDLTDRLERLPLPRAIDTLAKVRDPIEELARRVRPFLR